MIFVEFINRLIRKEIPLIFILLIGLVLRLYKIGQAFPFDFDQEVPANAAYDFFVNHKITLVGQELSFKGFFLGPLHNWIQFVPYKFCGLLPDCIPYFYILIGLFTIIVLYLTIKVIFDSKTAFIASAIYAISFSAISFERGVNSNYFLFLSSIGLLFCLYKYFLGENKYFILGSFIAGVAVVNFNPVFIFSTIAFFITALLRAKKNLIIFISSGFAFLINYLPLVIFNFRHDNILWDNFFNFINQNAASSNYLEKSIFLFRDVSLPFFSYYLFQSGSLIFAVITLALILIGIYFLLKVGNNFYLFLPIWIIVTLLGFIPYKGWVPNYYFQQTLLPVILLVSVSIRKNILIFLAFIFIFLFINVKSSVNYNTIINYNVKKDAVNYVINDSRGETFNVYYQLPIAVNTGYSFLFKVFGGIPQEGGKNLYIFEFDEPSYNLKLKYQKVFPGKMVSVGFDKFVKIVSIKNVN